MTSMKHVLVFFILVSWPKVVAMELVKTQSFNLQKNLFFEAAKEGDKRKIETALAWGVLISEQDEHGCNALHWALFFNHLSVAKFILKYAAKSNELESLMLMRPKCATRLTHIKNTTGKIAGALLNQKANRILTFVQNGDAELHDLQGKYIARLTHTCWQPLFSPQSDRIVTFTDGEAIVWDINGRRLFSLSTLTTGRIKQWGKYLLSATEESDVDGIFSPNGECILTFSHTHSNVALWDDKATFSLWDRNGKNLATIQQDGCICGYVSSDNTVILLSGSHYNSLSSLWTSDGKFILNIPAAGARFSYDGKYIITNHPNVAEAVVWNLKGQKLFSMKHENEYAIVFVSISKDGQWIATASISAGIATIWDFKGNKKATINTASIRSVKFSDDSKSIIIITGKEALPRGGVDYASEKHSVSLWNLMGKKSAIIYHGSAIESAQLSVDGNYLVTAGTDGNAVLWDLEAEKEIASLNHRTSFMEPQVTHDHNRILTVNDDGHADLWVLSGTPLDWAIEQAVSGNAAMLEVFLSQGILRAQYCKRNTLHSIVYCAHAAKRHYDTEQYTHLCTIFRLICENCVTLVNEKDVFGKTPLHWANFYGLSEIVAIIAEVFIPENMSTAYQQEFPKGGFQAPLYPVAYDRELPIPSAPPLDAEVFESFARPGHIHLMQRAEPKIKNNTDVNSPSLLVRVSSDTKDMLQAQAEEEDIEKCCICFENFGENIKKCAIVPCGHTETCYTCALKLKDCAECRHKIERVVQIYVSRTSGIKEKKTFEMPLNSSLKDAGQKGTSPDLRLASSSARIQEADDISSTFYTYCMEWAKIAKYLLNEERAAYRKSFEKLKRCGDVKSAVNMKFYKSKTMMHLAAREGDVQMLQQLHSYDAHINVKDEDGWTPLEIAAKWDHVAAIEFLLSLGADFEKAEITLNSSDAKKKVSEEKREPKAHALLSPNLQPAGIIKASKGEEWTRYHRACMEISEDKAYDAADRLLESPAGFSIFKNDLNPLHLACIKGYGRVVKRLIEFKPELKGVKTAQGLTPLYLAIDNNAKAVVSVLLTKGVQPQERDIALAQEKGDKGIINLLLK